MRLRYTRAALADLDSILNYIATRSPQGAHHVQARIKTVIEALAQHPNIGRPTNDPTIRRMTVTPFPYLIFYEAMADEVIVHAIRHSARDPSSMPGSGSA